MRRPWPALGRSATGEIKKKPALTVCAALFKKLPAFYGARSFMIALTGARHLALAIAG